MTPLSVVRAVPPAGAQAKRAETGVRPPVTQPSARHESWGRYPPVRPAGVVPVEWSCDPPDLRLVDGPLLAFGLGRSYGDSCQNEGGVLLDTSRMCRLLAFERDTGLLRCEAGASLADILDVVVPAGWFLPVTPGTKHVTVGGAIANDVHGKNHHRAGTFGNHVEGFELLRSSGERLWCSRDSNPDLFAATIGGLGLTGLILTAEFRLRRVTSPHIVVERIRYPVLRDFFALSDESDADHEYTVAWIDAFARGRGLGRGIFMRGNHAPAATRPPGARRRRVRVPLPLPVMTLAAPAMPLANSLYYFATAAPRARPRLQHYDAFFYPLDAVHRWNLLYGKRGFLQYQAVVPHGDAEAVSRELLGRVAASRNASFLAVLKRFGDLRSPGILSFPRPGLTIALDIAFRGPATLALCAALDGVVAAAGGVVYPAKDARMSAASFRSFYPEVDSFRQWVDPRFSSSFWRRVDG